MAQSPFDPGPLVNYLAEEDEPSHDFKAFISSLPQGKGWPSPPLYQYQGFWYLPAVLRQGTLTCQNEFKAQDTDIFLATFVKTGTTWLKALAYSVLNRIRYSSSSQHPLLTPNPHDLVPNLELSQPSLLTNLPSPRLIATHLPLTSLPDVPPRCKMVYLCPHPRDTFLSLWLFAAKVVAKLELPLAGEEAVELFCQGGCPYGPYWDRVLGYWRESVERPERVLFLRYEDVKEDCGSCLKKLAGFLGCPFSVEEVEGGVEEEITELCSFGSLSNLEVNKRGVTSLGTETSAFFRRGEVGDWRNFLTDQMVEKIDQGYGAEAAWFRPEFLSNESKKIKIINR